MSLWGEIVEPASRAWTDDNEEGESGVNRLQWSADLLPKENIDSLIILEGKHFSGYSGESANCRLINSIPKVNLKLYENEQTSRIICVLKDYDLIRSSEIVDLLTNYLLLTKKLIAVVSKPLADYRTERLSGGSVVRSLCTTSLRSKAPYPRLDQPNIVCGVSAGALTLREHLNKEGTMYVCYLDHPSSTEAEELRALVKSLDIGQLAPLNSNLMSSNLYT